MRRWSVVLVGLLGGCAPKVTAPPPQVVVLPSAPAAESPSPVAAVLSAVGYAVLLPISQQKEEVARYTAAFERDRLPSDRLRLALMLTLGDPGVQDAARARSLLTEAPFSADQGAYEALARLILALLREQEGRTADANAAAVELAAERARRKEAEEKATALEELERRLEALKALETGAR